MTIRHTLVTAALGLVFTLTSSAQWMPHDNWRASGVEFGSPTNNNLRSIAIGSGGVYVAELNGSNPTQILQFTEAGVFVRRFSMDFGFIHGIACDAAGNVYVLSRGLTRVRVFDPNGTFIREWGQWGHGDGQFDLEAATGNTLIAVNSKNNEVYVCDPGNSRVQVFNSAGTFLRKWGQAGSLPGQFQAGSPSAIAVSDNGNVVLGSYTGTSDPQVKVFDANGNYLKGTTPDNILFGLRAMAATNDGLVFVQSFYYNNDNPTYMYTRMLDPGDNYGNIGGMPAIVAIGGAAFSSRGNFYSVYNNRVSIAYREYSNASNFLAPPAIPQPMILSASQRAGTNLVDVNYQVKDADSATVTTALLAVRDGDTKNRTGYSVPARTFIEGTAANIGNDQPTGVTRHVVWNMPADWGIDYATFEFEVLAKDSRSLLGIHWITVPASGGDPAIQVSAAPITNPQLRDLWLWYLGTGLVNQTYYLNGGNGWLGTIWGKSGVYTGIKLAQDYDNPYTFQSNPTPAGLVYAYEQMGAHPITPAELARAQAGKYGFSSVDSNSIVKNLAPTTSYLKGWGRNDYGQSSWQQFSAPNISKVAAGGNACTFFIRADGTLWGVGYNNYGQLGDGTTTARTGPIQIATGVTEVATGGNHTLFTKTDGSLWAMGLNDYGQLGDGTTINRPTPVQVLPSGVSKVACGWQYSLFVKTTGELFAMGLNNFGQLGDLSTTNRSTPVLVTTGVAQVSAGMHHSLYVTAGGSLFATGYNNYGQLGNNSTTNRSTPVQVATDVAQASASTGDDQGHSVYVKTNGSLWAMGRNTHGQLGNGTLTNSSVPLQIVASGVSQAFAGTMHTVFLKTDKTIWSTGLNNYGQLGDNTTTNRNTPAQFDVNATAIAVGGYHTLAITLP
ncbi:MAG: hypothetical protein NTW21_17420 [Verrucomicrobia bacterium]|nr:hypothetical protein [Verrucomicrobiota bacterium]